MLALLSHVIPLLILENLAYYLKHTLYPLYWPAKDLLYGSITGCKSLQTKQATYNKLN